MKSPCFFLVWLENSARLVNWFNVYRCLQVWVIVCFNNPGDADELLTFDLPILKEMGAQVYSKCKSIRPISCWIEDLKKKLSDS